MDETAGPETAAMIAAKIAGYKEQLAQVAALSQAEPGNKVYAKLVTDLAQLITLTEELVRVPCGGRTLATTQPLIGAFALSMKRRNARKHPAAQQLPLWPSLLLLLPLHLCHAVRMQRQPPG